MKNLNSIRITALLILSVFVSVTMLYADDVRITQIDSSGLLLSQTVNLYLDVTNDSGNSIPNLQPEMFSVYESGDGVNFRQVPRILGLRTQPNLTEGINFLLLIDNSGSMYDSLDDTATTDVENMKVTKAKRAIRTFLDSVTNPRDTIGLASFNTLYQTLSTPEAGNRDLAAALDQIERPVPDQAFTELYASLYLASDYMSDLSGRKVIIVLSDGENYPFTVRKKEPHPRFGDRIYEYGESIDRALREGVTIFSIRFGKMKDTHLQEISDQTGGLVFDAANEQELSDVYLEIRNRILREYMLSYRASMIPADKKFVRVDFNRNSGTAQDTRYYFSSMIFGLPLPNLTLLLFIPFILAVAMWFVLTKLKYEHASTHPLLEVIDPGEGKTSARVIPLGSKKTVIGGSEKADLTIVGSPTVKQEHATVVFDNASNTYTVVGDGDIKVNNQKVTSRKLEPGDVINVGGTTIVFDASEENDQKNN